MSPARWLRRVFTGDAALTIRPSQSDAAGAEFLVCMLKLIHHPSVSSQPIRLL